MRRKGDGAGVGEGVRNEREVEIEDAGELVEGSEA